MGKRFLAVMTAFVIAVTAPFTAFCKENSTLSGIKSAVEGVVSYKCAAEGVSTFPELLDKLSAYAGTYSADWYYIAFSRYGLDCNNAKSIDSLKNKVEEFYSEDLADVKVTDMQRVAFALSSCGVDITDIDGHNLLADATYNRAKVKPLNSQGINSAAYALILLDYQDYSVPDDAMTTRENMIELILKSELKNGGFSLFGSNPDIDMTSIVVQALSPYKNRADVKSALDRCIGILSSRQDSTGGYKSFSNEISCESTAQVVLCLSSMGINPASDKWFIKNGNSVMDGLNVFRLGSGAFSHFKDGKADNMATYQALCALVGAFRFMNGEKSFYDFTGKPKPITVKIKKQTASEFTKSTINNSKNKNKSGSTASVTETQKPTEKTEAAAKKTNKKSKTKSSIKDEIKAGKLSSTAESTAVYNSLQENKTAPETENKRSALYIDCSLLAAAYITLVIIKRRKK